MIERWYSGDREVGWEVVQRWCRGGSKSSMMQRRTRHDDELVELPAVAEVLERQRHLLPAGLLLAC